MVNQFSGKTILVVDDEAELREIMCEEFEMLGAKVHQASNGRAAYELYAQFQPDAIISDIRMPDGDGLELLKQIRSLSPQVTPVFFFTTGHSDLSQSEAAELGAQAMLPKPFDLNRLRQLLADHLLCV